MNVIIHISEWSTFYLRLLWPNIPRKENIYGPRDINPYKQDEFYQILALCKIVFYCLG